MIRGGPRVEAGGTPVERKGSGVHMEDLIMGIRTFPDTSYGGRSSSTKSRLTGKVPAITFVERG
jgi:hypothetical protein